MCFFAARLKFIFSGTEGLPCCRDSASEAGFVFGTPLKVYLLIDLLLASVRTLFTGAFVSTNSN
jgi:hypothetical protein